MLLKNLEYRNLRWKFCLIIKKFKNRKVVFAYISQHCASFGTKSSIWPLLEVSGLGLHIVLFLVRKYLVLMKSWSNSVYHSPGNPRHGVLGERWHQHSPLTSEYIYFLVQKYLFISHTQVQYIMWTLTSLKLLNKLEAS